MRIYITICLFFLFLNGHCQADKIDTLIGKIWNDQLILHCGSTATLQNTSKEADSLISLSITSWHTWLEANILAEKLGSEKKNHKMIDSLNKAGRKYYALNNEINDKLYHMLPDSRKDIIIHFILSNIKFGGSKFDVTCLSHNDSVETIEYHYNNFTFFQNKFSKIFSTGEEQQKMIRDWYNFFYVVYLFN